MVRRMIIAKGQRIRLTGRDYEFFNAVPSSDVPDGPHDLQFRDVVDHRILLMSQAEFDRLYDGGEVKWWNAYERPHDDAPADACVDGDDCNGCGNCKERRRRGALQQLMRVFDDAPVAKTDRALQQFLDERAVEWPSGSGVYPKAAVFRRMLREWGEAGDRRLRYIGRRRGPSGACRPRLHPVAEEVLWEKAQAYFTDRTVKADDVWASVQVDVNARNADRALGGLTPIKAPSRSTVWRMLTRHSDYDRTRSRLGARRAQRAFMPLKGRLEAKRILDVAIMDHTVVDCFIVDDEHFIPVGRPYLTFLIDARSRYPLGFHVGFTPPSVESAMACLRQAVRPKDRLNRQHPDVQKWEVFGVPRTVLVDNGWEFIGRSFKDACEDAGISVEWAPVKTPEYKGIVERFFGTLNTGLFHKLKGGVPHKPHLLSEYGIDPQAEAVLLLSELNELIHQFVVEVYGRDFHTGMKAVPEQVWRSREAIDGIEYVKDLRGLDLGLSKVAGIRTLTRKGIEFNGLTYNSDVVFDLLNTMLPHAVRRGVSAHSVKVKVKYWPDDLSQVAVWNSQTKEYVSVPCTSREYAAGLGEHHHSIIQRYAREQGLAFSSDSDRAAARVRLTGKMREMVSDRQLIATRRRAQRWTPGSCQETDGGRDVHPHGGLEIETLSRRQQGDVLQKGRSRKPKRKAGHASTIQQSSGRAEPFLQTTEAAPKGVADPFGTFDRSAMLARIRREGGNERSRYATPCCGAPRQNGRDLCRHPEDEGGPRTVPLSDGALRGEPGGQVVRLAGRAVAIRQDAGDRDVRAGDE